MLLRKDTFYLWKRYYFLVALPLSFLFPFIDFSRLFTPVQAQTIQQITSHFPINVSGAEKGFVIQDSIPFVIMIGTVVLLIRIGIQLTSLWEIHKKSTSEKDFNDCKIRKMHTVTNPFSFFRTIYINPTIHNTDEMKAILNHEQIHVTQWHSVDIMLFEITCAICWYNPLVWLLKRAMRQNIEFYTDKQILKAGYDRRQYQQELLKVSQIPTYLKIVNNFNFNHLKKRITMMNKDRKSVV
jgi:beta-lactamase regulating signal transducer with metallopeptidase domain